MIEMITGEKPYSECNGEILTVCDRVKNGILPECFNKITSENAKKFILKCLKPENERPSAGELLLDEFLNDEKSEENNYPAIYIENPKILSCRSSGLIFPEKNNKISENIYLDDLSSEEKKSVFTCNLIYDNKNSKVDSFSIKNENTNINNKNNIELLKKNLNKNITETKTGTEIFFALNEDLKKSSTSIDNLNDNEIYKLILVKKKGENVSKFKFNYMLNSDSIQGVINELAKVVDLNSDEIKECEKKLKISISELKEKNKEKEKNELEQQINLINNCYDMFIREYNDNVKQIQELNQLYQEIKKNEKDYTKEEILEIDNKMSILLQMK